MSSLYEMMQHRLLLFFTLKKLDVRKILTVDENDESRG